MRLSDSDTDEPAPKRRETVSKATTKKALVQKPSVRPQRATRGAPSTKPKSSTLPNSSTCSPERSRKRERTPEQNEAPPSSHTRVLPSARGNDDIGEESDNSLEEVKVPKGSFTEKVFKQNIRLRDALTDRDETIRGLQNEVKGLNVMIAELRVRLEGTVGGISDITEESFSGEAVTSFATNVALEWTFSIGPDTVCLSSDELRPFKSPFDYIHWGPFFNGREKYIAPLKSLFLHRMLIQETEKVAKMFMDAYNRKSPTPGIKSTIFDKRRNMKSYRITKKVLKYLERNPSLVIEKGHEWRTDEAMRGGSWDPVNGCPFLNSPGSRKLFDSAFFPSPLYDAESVEKRRLVSLTQLGMMDAIFLQKYKKVQANSVVDYRVVALGSDKEILDQTRKLIEFYFNILKGARKTCDCCLLVDRDGVPSVAGSDDTDGEDEDYDDNGERERLRQEAQADDNEAKDASEGMEDEDDVPQHQPQSGAAAGLDDSGSEMHGVLPEPRVQAVETIAASDDEFEDEDAVLGTQLSP